MCLRLVARGRANVSPPPTHTRTSAYTHTHTPPPELFQTHTALQRPPPLLWSEGEKKSHLCLLLLQSRSLCLNLYHREQRNSPQHQLQHICIAAGSSAWITCRFAVTLSSSLLPSSSLCLSSSSSSLTSSRAVSVFKGKSDNCLSQSHCGFTLLYYCSRLCFRGSYVPK